LNLIDSSAQGYTTYSVPVGQLIVFFTPMLVN